MSGFVYFIAAETVDAVKIGFSRNHPSARLKQLQIGCPIPLKLRGYIKGGVDRELDLHRTFADLKIHSEWFRLEGPLLEMIARLPAPTPPRPVVRPKCPLCGTKASPGYSHMVGNTMKICRGWKAKEAVK